MKKINTWYWIFTAIFAAFMLMSGIQSFFPQAAKMMHDMLGYPGYIVPFLGVAKVLGVVAILVPGFPKIREWAYAGFMFDLLGATYSSIMSLKPGEPVAPLFGMIIFFVLFIGSYTLHHKRLKAKATTATA